MGLNSYAFQRFCDWRTGDMYTRSVSPGGTNVWRKAVITTTDGYARAPKHGTTLTTIVTALNTPTQIVQSEGAAGILVMRDDTLGGTGVWLVDPNTGIVPLANMLTGVTIEGAGQAGGYRWSVKVSQGPVP